MAQGVSLARRTIACPTAGYTETKLKNLTGEFMQPSAQLPPATSAVTSTVVCEPPARITWLGEAFVPVAQNMRLVLSQRAASPGSLFVVFDDLLKHMDVITRALAHLSPQIDYLMGHVVQREGAGKSEVFRAVGRLEQVISEFADGYLEAKATQPTAETGYARNLLLGVYRHHIREICEWLEELAEVIANPVRAMEKRGIAPSGNVVLTVALTMTSPPEMAKLDELATAVLTENAPVAERKFDPDAVQQPGFWGTAGALVFGMGIANAVLGRNRN